MNTTTTERAAWKAKTAVNLSRTTELPEAWMFRQAALLSDVRGRWWARPLRRYLAPLQAGLAAYASDVRRMREALDDLVAASQEEVATSINRQRIEGGSIAMDSVAVELERLLRAWKPKSLDPEPENR